MLNITGAYYLEVTKGISGTNERADDAEETQKLKAGQAIMRGQSQRRGIVGHDFRLQTLVFVMKCLIQ